MPKDDTCMQRLAILARSCVQEYREWEIRYPDGRAICSVNAFSEKDALDTFTRPNGFKSYAEMAKDHMLSNPSWPGLVAVKVGTTFPSVPRVEIVVCDLPPSN